MALKKDMIEVFIPTLDQVKKIHDQITNGPDRRFQWVHEHPLCNPNRSLGKEYKSFKSMPRNFVRPCQSIKKNSRSSMQ